MAKYQEAFTGKLDWAMPFQRSGGFPLDRSSMFESYADALAYAKQDLTDTRKLGATAYVGQLIVVYGNDAGVTDEHGNTTYTQEVAGYIITAVGESASLMKLAQTTASGDFAKDITALNTAVGALEKRIKDLEDKPQVTDTNTQYDFDTASTTDGAIKITNLDDNTSKEVQIKGWDSLVNLATGRTSAFVYQNANDPRFITDAKNPDAYKVGDIIYFTDTKIADMWVTSKLSAADNEGIWFTFANLEGEKPDLSQYLTANEISITYATKETVNQKADQSTVTDLQTTVSENKTESDNAFIEVNKKLGTVKVDSQGNPISLQSQIDNIDVTTQITNAITDLDVNSVGGQGQYIKSIKQVDGKIEATPEALPDFDGNAQGYAAAAKSEAVGEAKGYVDEKIGAINEADVKTFVETQIGAINTNIATNVTPKLQGLETTVGNHTTWIESKEAVIGNNTTRISTLETNVGNLGSRVTTTENNIATLQTAVQNAGKVNSVKIHYKNSDGTSTITTEILPDENKVLNFTNGISTDWLTTGT